MLAISEAEVRRFWSKVALPDSNGCMRFTAGRRKPGANYGGFWLHGRTEAAHRVSLYLAAGSPPDLLRTEAAHSCRNQNCVAPNHLRWATRKENDLDRVADGTDPVGERNGRAKLTESTVREMRTLYATGGFSQHQLAVMFSVSHALVSFVVTRKVWGHVA